MSQKPLFLVVNPPIPLKTSHISLKFPLSRWETPISRGRPLYLIRDHLIALENPFLVVDPTYLVGDLNILLATMISRWRPQYLVGDSHISLETSISRWRPPYLVGDSHISYVDPHISLKTPIISLETPYLVEDFHLFLKDQISFSHKLRFSYPLSLQLMLETIDISNHEFYWIKYYQYKYQRVAPSGCNNIGIRKFEFMAKALSKFTSQKCLKTLIYVNRKQVFFQSLQPEQFKIRI